MESDPINRPEVIAELRAAFELYEAALLNNDIAALNAFFWGDERAVRYGIAEHGHGIAAIRRFRAEAPPVHAGRRLNDTVINTFGSDAGSVSTEFTAPNTAMIGRQTQTWIRLGADWRIVSAHVSLIDPGALKRY